MTEPRISKVEVGDEVPFDDDGSLTTKPPCEDKRNGRWRCVTHKEGFANQLQKDIHIGNGKEHRLAWVCFEHGVERP